MRTTRYRSVAKQETSRFPSKERAYMPGSTTTPGRPSARDGAPVRIAFRTCDSVGTQNYLPFAALWLACTSPCRRFADTLADDCARFGANADRYSFTAMDLHHLLLAGLPALRKKSNQPRGCPPVAGRPFRMRSAGKSSLTLRFLSLLAGNESRVV